MMLAARMMVSRGFGATALRAAATGAAAPLDAGRLVVERTKAPKAKVANDKLTFGHTFTDHMLEAKWTKKGGWAAPQIRPYGPFSLDPAAMVFHYAPEVFEGMKAYIDGNGKARLFRPDRNMARLAKSADRLFLPEFDQDQLLACIKELVKADKDWIPREKGYSLYIRPTLIGTTPFLGVAPATDATLFVITCPVGPYYKSGFAPVKLLSTRSYVRAWPGGTGEAKCGGNYAPGIRPQVEANSKGYAQVLWLFGEDDYVTEVGTMNFFVHWRNAAGKEELMTAPLDGTILEGVTRASIIELARAAGVTVTERQFTMKELLAALADGRVLECFGAGTAAIVSPVNGIAFDGKDYTIPLGAADPAAKGLIGPLAKTMVDQIMAIQYGEVDHPWSVVID